MLIYDHFETIADAATFAAAVVALDEDRDLVITSRRLDQVDPFPYELDGVLVYVGRLEHDDDATPEATIAQLAVDAGGRFAGT